MSDVVVIGGGPAGCAAVLTLRALGISTILISSGRFREKPTETAVPRLRQLLKSLGAESTLVACEPCYGIESSWGPHGASFQPSILDASGHAWFIHRKPFDTNLGHLVNDAGVIRLEAEVENLSFSNSGVSVGTNAGTFTAESAVIATGSPAWTARITGQKPMIIDTLVCYWARLAIPVESRLLQVESDPHGWWYTCPGEQGEVVACFVTDAEDVRLLNPSQLEGWTKLFRKTRLGRSLGCFAVSGGINRIPIGVGGLTSRRGPRWVAAGDAAIKLDPIGSSGTATALESGILAAHAAINRRTDGPDAGEQYDRWGKGLLKAFLKLRAPLYGAESAKHPGGFWSRRNA